MKARADVPALLLVSLAASACTPRREPNMAWALGVRVSHVRHHAGSEAEGVRADAGTAALLAAEGSAVGAEGSTTGRGRLSVALGGNADGLAGEIDAALLGGPRAPLGGNAHLFARLGASLAARGSPYAGFYALELPAVEGGFQVRDPTTSGGSLHAEIGPRAGLFLAGTRLAGEGSAPFGLAPAAGVAGTLRGELVAFDASLRRIFESEPADVARLSSCVGLFLVLCADARFSSGAMNFSGAGLHAETLYVGVTVGIGMVTGLSFP